MYDVEVGCKFGMPVDIAVDDISEEREGLIYVVDLISLSTGNLSIQGLYLYPYV